jgi:hypothetical protein
LSTPKLEEAENKVTHVTGDGISDGNDSAVPILAVFVGHEPTTAVWDNAIRVLGIVETF